ncbi:hypothetical protein CQW23_35297 [Capsicum baccatum]|uniref:Uncharacterized protein n=1 Tax=Capsicum baccatum TaxID=33114 RepID=A0A2G2UWG5_CAPBA|nr:hypothetical protein CQW23_35297 [Capsicum baccatum]
MGDLTETEPYIPKQLECDLKNQPTAKTHIDEPPMLETQELPDYLRYKRAMGWTIDDIIGDSPEKRMSQLEKDRMTTALDGIHRPICAAFPNNPPRRQRLVVRQGPCTTGLSPSPAPPSRGLGPGPPLRTLLQTTIRMTEPPDSKAGLFPIRSLLLWESLSERLSAKGSWSPDARRAVAATAKRVELQPPLAATSVDVDSHLG